MSTSATMVSPMQVPRRGKVNTFTEGRGSWEGYSKQSPWLFTDRVFARKERVFLLSFGPSCCPRHESSPFWTLIEISVSEIFYSIYFAGGASGKEPTCQCKRHGMRVWSLGGEDPLKKGMANNSGILAWRIPWTDGPGRLRSLGSQRVEHDWSDLSGSTTVYLTLSYWGVFWLFPVMGYFFKFLLQYNWFTKLYLIFAV